jgi:hypothetical protein
MIGRTGPGEPMFLVWRCLWSFDGISFYSKSRTNGPSWSCNTSSIHVLCSGRIVIGNENRLVVCWLRGDMTVNSVIENWRLLRHSPMIWGKMRVFMYIARAIWFKMLIRVYSYFYFTKQLTNKIIPVGLLLQCSPHWLTNQRTHGSRL